LSAHLSQIDREKKVLWISYEGRGDELEMNLRAYGVRYVPGFCNGRVGIEYSRRDNPPLGRSSELDEAAVTLVDILTMRQGVTKRHEAAFIAAQGVVQQHQADYEEAAS
jgi:hypothetical protein